ncbi:MAG: hypothetical protein V1754_07680 [Pseudomonadota bacterium]
MRRFALLALYMASGCQLVAGYEASFLEAGPDIEAKDAGVFDHARADTQGDVGNKDAKLSDEGQIDSVATDAITLADITTPHDSINPDKTEPDVMPADSAKEDIVQNPDVDKPDMLHKDTGHELDVFQPETSSEGIAPSDDATTSDSQQPDLVVVEAGTTVDMSPDGRDGAPDSGDDGPPYDLKFEELAPL